MKQFLLVGFCEVWFIVMYKTSQVKGLICHLTDSGNLDQYYKQLKRQRMDFYLTLQSESEYYHLYPEDRNVLPAKNNVYLSFLMI